MELRLARLWRDYYGYRFGKLEYRTVRFEMETLDTPNYQGNAVVWAYCVS